jgi:murein DD-endopeptidase MepM/ murein hydrolase activator NlpD
VWLYIKTSKEDDNANGEVFTIRSAQGWDGVFERSWNMSNFFQRPLSEGFLIGEEKGHRLRMTLFDAAAPGRNNNVLSVIAVIVGLTNSFILLMLYLSVPARSQTATRADVANIKTDIANVTTQLAVAQASLNALPGEIAEQIDSVRLGTLAIADEMKNRDSELLAYMFKLHKFDVNGFPKVRNELFGRTAVAWAFQWPVRSRVRPETKASDTVIGAVIMSVNPLWEGQHFVAVFPMRSGIVVDVKQESEKSGQFWTITLEHEFGYRTFYGHLASANVKPGKLVTTDSPIGQAQAASPICLRVWFTRPRSNTPLDPTKLFAPWEQNGGS